MKLEDIHQDNNIFSMQESSCLSSSSSSLNNLTKSTSMPPKTPEEVTKALELARLIQAMSDSKKVNYFIYLFHH